MAGLLVILGVGVGFLLAPLVLRRPLALWPRRFRRRIGRSLLALRHLSRQPRTAALALTLALAMQSAFILISAWPGHAVGAHAPLWAWFTVWPLAKVAGMLPVTMGGLGVRDAALATLLVPFGGPAAFGLVASLPWNAVLIGGACVGGHLWWLIRPGRAVAHPRPHHRVDAVRPITYSKLRVYARASPRSDPRCGARRPRRRAAAAPSEPRPRHRSGARRACRRQRRQLRDQRQLRRLRKPSPPPGVRARDPGRHPYASGSGPGGQIAPRADPAARPLRFVRMLRFARRQPHRAVGQLVYMAGMIIGAFHWVVSGSLRERGVPGVRNP